MSRVSATTQGDALSEISSDWVTDFGQTNIWENIVELFSSLAVVSERKLLNFLVAWL